LINCQLCLHQTFELVAGRTLLEAGFKNQDLIPQFEKVLGGLPQQWIQDAIEAGVLQERPDGASSPTARPGLRTSSPDFSLAANVPSVDSSAQYFSPLEEELQKCCWDGNDIENSYLCEDDLGKLGSYLRRLLVVDPTQRATAHDLLDDPWAEEQEEEEEEEEDDDDEEEEEKREEDEEEKDDGEDKTKS
jgi:hypothetical protein